MAEIVRSALMADCRDLAPRLREADVEELKAGLGRDPETALLDGASRSKAAWAVEHNGRVCAIFGVGDYPTDPKIGVPWLLASPEIEDFSTRFLKGSRRYVELMQSWYPLLTNYVDERHEAAVKWIEWCGFTPYRRLPNFGLGKVPFIQYIRY